MHCSATGSATRGGPRSAPSPGADVGGVSPIPVAAVGAAGPVPGADVAAVSPVPVQMWLVTREDQEVYCAPLRILDAPARALADGLLGRHVGHQRDRQCGTSCAVRLARNTARRALPTRAVRAVSTQSTRCGHPEYP